ncbi:MAG: DEAD/DEAH box helicase family protein [Sedimenticola sp.]
MSLSIAHQLCHRMSLRKPQEKALELLVAMAEALSLDKEPDMTAALEAIQGVEPCFDNFERDFPSICFALATGVGKTRLMGAFIAYLYITGRSAHFLLLAPNLTIYQKLIEDFTFNTPKYVFRGIAELALKPPVIVTGDNYDEGRGIRHDQVMNVTGDMFSGGPVINIFNIAKINAKENKKGATKSGLPRTRRLLETLGQSYFSYLAELDDLVVLMDEAHRYHAKAGAKAIGELNPILGLELTATPKTIGARPRQFKNIVYHYPLSHALADGFVKNPAVATRKDFDPLPFKDKKRWGELQIIMLEDGIHHHEFVRVELERYAYENKVERIKPFMLVVAKETTHSGELKTIIESDSFFEGRYRGKVIEVHSNQGAEESDEAMQRLLAVEQDNDTEIVIHVNKLKEGWDVKNLYTIVPLRASAAEILTEQTIGRGLRLPYGYRTGDVAVDRLTIIAHDRFQEIIDRANNPNSIIHESVTIGEGGDIPASRNRLLEIPTHLEAQLTGQAAQIEGADFDTPQPEAVSTPLDPRQAAMAKVTLEIIRQQEHRLKSAQQLTQPEVQQRIRKQVGEHWAIQAPTPQLPRLEPEAEAKVQALLDEVVAAATSQVATATIDIPNIIVMPDNLDQSYTFENFDLVNTESINYPPVSEELLIRSLTDNRQTSIQVLGGFRQERRLEDYVVRELMDNDAIDYDAHSDLLYKLAGQVVSRLRVLYKDDEDEIRKALIAYQKPLGEFIWVQMEAHLVEPPTNYKGKVTRGFSLLQPLLLELREDDTPRNFRHPLTEKSRIRQMVFAGFKKCSYPYQKFDSAEGELRMAMVLEDDENVLKWLKPAPGQFRIEYSRGRNYQPDFVVETKDRKLIIEPKRADQIASEEVQEKAAAARQWVGFANEHVDSYGGKPWHYLLIPHDRIRLGATVNGLALQTS